MINVNLEISERKANVNVSASKPNAQELAVAICQLELLKLDLLAKLAKQSKNKI